ncbi:MAG: hypothetical protein ACK5MI_09640 [Mangrovibacterium sp.]
MKLIYSLSIIFLISALSSCSKDPGDPTPIQPEPQLAVCYSFEHSNDSKLIEVGDTINMTWTDSITVSVETGDSLSINDLVFDCPEGINSTDKGKYQYLISPSVSGLFQVVVLINTSDSVVVDNSFYINTPIVTYSLENRNVMDFSYTIDVEDNELKTKILDDIKHDGMSYLKTIDLTCNSLTSGSYLGVVIRYNDTIPGKFTSTNTLDLEDFTLAHDGFNYYATLPIEKEFSDGSAFCTFKQNLTKMYQQKYDSPDIKEVSISTSHLYRKRTN